MRRVSYKGHLIELDSHKLPSGKWTARATVVIKEAIAVKRVPIFGRRQASFDLKRQADAYAFELARLWVEGRLFGANGQG
jgi:hypothetical protein